MQRRGWAVGIYPRILHRSARQDVDMYALSELLGTANMCVTIYEHAGSRQQTRAEIVIQSP
jgi:hypothetical protein